MNIFHVFILSVVEGITEFLPVSSTGHMILVSHLLRIPQTEFLKTFEIIIQLGAIGAVALVSLRSLFPTITDWRKILLSFIPTSIIGFILYKLVKSYLLGNDVIVVITLMLGGIFLIFIERYFSKKQHPIGKINEISDKNAVLIGLCQALSIIPGVSRSAATIIGAMSLGVKRETAVSYSFLLAIPTMLAASGLDIVKTRLAFSSQELLSLILGFGIAFAVAYITVIYFLKYIRTHTFVSFGIYRIVIAILYFVLVIR